MTADGKLKEQLKCTVNSFDKAIESIDIFEKMLASMGAIE